MIDTYEELIQEWMYWNDLHSTMGLEKMMDFVDNLDN